MAKTTRTKEATSIAPAHDPFEAALWPVGHGVAPRTLRCRACEGRNRVAVPAAVLTPERHSCGHCSEPLFLTTDEPLTRIASSAYQHSLDRRSLSALSSLPGATRVIRWMLGSVGDRSAHLQFMSDAILCGEDQFPELLTLMERARHSLDMPKRPTIFLGESPHMNAVTTGVDDPVIMVRSALLDQMGDDELVAILGHELGHLHANHPLYLTVARTLMQGGMNASHLVRLLGMPLHTALMGWSRCAELTADRAALLASRDLRACISMMLTFAGGRRPGTSNRTQMHLAPFIRQCRELAKLQSNYSVDGLLGTYMALDRSHPHLAWRVMHLLQWVEHGSYLEILTGRYPRRVGPPGPEPRFLTTNTNLN